ncbi:hypothetical protein L1O03_00975 [Corynebacterium uropygiale]|uniref:Rv3660c-like CheY-like N-terminal domain-containing protein n=1 Tax=Corynebacterium uropygiale TaxID=1775911 RepID=A0A9X1U6J6_9CORY|nr:septum site-determining protein Ssd [Corynebacterium uropygiale]MCF4005752.1 hypothetical protein [Corynebacterium uropygiale]
MNSILVAVTDPTLHPEAVHIAAATGRKVIDTTDPRDITRHLAKVDAVLVDEGPAAHVGSSRRRDRIYVVAPDPGPVPWQAVAAAHAERAFVLPAQATDLLAELGRSDGMVVSSRRGPAREHREHGAVLAVTSCCGGAGTSTLAAACALQASSNGFEAMLIDGDADSGGIDLLCGLEQHAGLRWPDLTFGHGSVDGEDVRRAVPSTTSGLAVLSSSRSTLAGEAERDAALLAVALRDLAAVPGLCVLDLPPYMVSSARDIADMSSACDRIVMIVPAEIRPVSAAARRIARWREVGSVPAMDIVLRHRGWSGLSAEEVEEILGQPVTAELPHLGRIAKHSELSGLSLPLPAPLRRVAVSLLEEMGWA